jgi:hypothetical protein
MTRRARRGDVLAEFAYEPFAAPLVARLEEARAATEEVVSRRWCGSMT